jgi:hypothetical protein
LLRLLFGSDRFGLQFLTLVPGLAWFMVEWLLHRADWNWKERLPALLFASLLIAPYGAWPFDLTVLLIPVLRVATGYRISGATAGMAAALYVGANVLAAASVVGRVDFFWWIWLTPALLLAYAVAVRRPRPLRVLATDHAGGCVP